MTNGRIDQEQLASELDVIMKRIEAFDRIFGTRPLSLGEQKEYAALLKEFFVRMAYCESQVLNLGGKRVQIGEMWRFARDHMTRVLEQSWEAS
jgi:hypothetical protein